MELRQLSYLLELLKPRRRVYLDHNATTAPSKAVRRSMARTLRKVPGNPSAIYQQGRQAARALERARQQVALSLGASTSEIYFTASATESNNTILKSLSDHFHPEKKRIISTPIEHPSVMRTLDYLESQGMEVNYCQVSEAGRVDPEALKDMLGDDCFLLCCMLANNDIGTLQDLQSIAELAHGAGALVMSDCVQAFGKVPVHLGDLGVDYASFSAHKLYGPKGIGALYVRKGSPIHPILHGGSQEEGLRAGTEGLHNIVGFGRACADVPQLLEEAARVEGLRNALREGLEALLPKCSFNSPMEHCLPNTLHVRFPGMPNSRLLAMLDSRGIAASAGSACSAKKHQVSGTLKAIGLDDQAARESLRFSLGIHSTSRDIRYTLRSLKACLEGRVRHVPLRSAAQLKDDLRCQEDLVLLDLSPRMLQGRLDPIPGSLRISFPSLNRHLDQLPKDKDLLVICQQGNLSYLATYYLLGKGFTRVSSLSGGLAEWHAL